MSDKFVIDEYDEYNIYRIIEITGYYQLNPYRKYGMAKDTKICLSLQKNKYLHRERPETDLLVFTLTKAGKQRLYTVFGNLLKRDTLDFIERTKIKISKYEAYPQKDITVLSIIEGSKRDLENALKRLNEIQS